MAAITSRLHLVVEGRVQGVGFRQFVIHYANQLVLTGWVRNLSGGDVEVLAEGPQEDLEKLLKIVQRGPQSAVVRNVQVEWDTASGNFVDFDVEYTI